MALGLFLILIVVLPFCIYLYITNKKLKQTIEQLEIEKQKILERKILNSKEIDTKSIEVLSTSQSDNQKNIQKTNDAIPSINNIKCRSGIPLNHKNTDTQEKKEIFDNKESEIIKLTDYEQEQENKAIISYQELIKTIEENKPKESKAEEKSETEQFLESLRSFRNKLKP